MANTPIIPFNPNGPARSDVPDTKPYVGKPKPQVGRPTPPGYSAGGGSFDPSSLRRAPRPVQILPGQGQGPMPVGTKPLPMPNVRDARGGLGMIRDASMRQYPGVPNWGGGPDEIWQRPPGWDGSGVDSGFSGPKPIPTPGGQVVAPGIGMPSQYGGGPSGRGGMEDVYNGMEGAVRRGPGATGMPSGGNPPQGPRPGGGGRQPLRPGMEYRPGGGQRLQGPRGGVQAPPGMDPNIWAGMDEETKRRWMSMAGGGGMQPLLPNEQGQAGLQVDPQYSGWDPRMGSGYYGAF